MLPKIEEKATIRRKKDAYDLIRWYHPTKDKLNMCISDVFVDKIDLQ